jgi:tetratricopeptide (TPR) repeat protein
MRLLTLLGLLLPLVAQAQKARTGEDLDLAKAHFRTGEIYYEKGRYPDAAREFEEAYRLSNRAELLYNMGKAYDGDGDAARALGAYRRFLENVKGSSDRPWVEGRVGQLRKVVGRLTVTSNVTGAAVKVDGKEVGLTPLSDVIDVNPGTHEVALTHEGHATFKKSVIAAPGSEIPVQAEMTSLVKVIRVEVEQKDKPAYKKWWPWTIFAGVVVVAGVTTAAVLATRPGDGCTGACAQLPAVRLPSP